MLRPSRARLVHLIFYLSLLFSYVSCDTKSKLTFFRNGENFPGTKGVGLDMPEYQSTVNSVLVRLQQAAPELLPKSEIGTTRVFNDRGLEVMSTKNFVPGNYYLLPPGKLWMWPSVNYGHKITFPQDEIKSSVGKDLALESVALSPRIFVIHNLLNEQEAADLIEHASTRIQKSTVGSVTPQIDHGRTSESTFDSTIPASKDIIRRVYKVLRIPYNGRTVDGLQIVKYAPGKFYNEHFDFLEEFNATPENNMIPSKGGTNRYATVFFYLNEVEDGGQTGFPMAPALTDEQLAQISPEVRPLLSSHKTEVNKTRFVEVLGRDTGLEMNMLDTCHSKFSVRPRKLSAVLFYNTDPLLVKDEQSKHAGCPVIEGTKWGANLWVWNGDKNGLGVPSALKVTFINKMDTLISVFWNDNGKRIKLIDFAPGESSMHDTYHNHVFDFFRGGALVDKFVVDFHHGDNQQVNVPTDGEQPNTSNMALEITNQSDETLSVFWLNNGELSFLSELPPRGGTQHGTTHGHHFEIRRGLNDENGELLKTYVMDVAGGKQQRINVYTDSIVTAKERGWFDFLPKFEL